MSLSVIIATYNRAESLRVTLESLCRAERPADVPFEVLVVDNNSADNTRQVCDEFASRLPLRYLFEPRQGKSFALNRAIELAKGELLLFTDDDTDIDQYWLKSYWDASRRHPDACIFGGKVFPRLSPDTPGWFAAHAHGLLRYATGYFDAGEEEAPGPWIFLGANMVLRRSALDGEERYREDVSIVGGIVRCIRGAEENEIQTRLRGKGCKGVYVPTAIVHHRLLRRPDEAYVRATFRSNGINEVRLGEVKMRNVFLGAPLYYWKLWVSGAVWYGLTRWSCPSRIWLQAEIRTAHAWGVVSECRRAKGEGLEAKR